MFTLHTGFFARLLAAIAVVGLLLGGATTSVMAMSMTQNDITAHAAMPAGAMQGSDMSHRDVSCEKASHTASACSDSDSSTIQCNAGGDCCPHGASAIPPQIDAAFVPLPNVQAAAPLWRSTSVTSVTEIRPPISTL